MTIHQIGSYHKKKKKTNINKKIWRCYIFVILGGVVVLQFIQSQGVGTQGSPSFIRALPADKKRNALTKFAVKKEYG